VINCKYLIDFI